MSREKILNRENGITKASKVPGNLRAEWVGAWVRETVSRWCNKEGGTSKLE